MMLVESGHSNQKPNDQHDRIQHTCSAVFALAKVECSLIAIGAILVGEIIGYTGKRKIFETGVRPPR